MQSKYDNKTPVYNDLAHFWFFPKLGTCRPGRSLLTLAEMQKTTEQTALRIADAFTATRRDQNLYNTELAMEALLLLVERGLPGKYADYVAQYIRSQGLTPATVRIWSDQQFHDISYPWFAFHNQLEECRESYIACTGAWIKEAARRPNGSIIHHCTHNPVGSLIDMVQACMIRLCRSAELTGNAAYVEEAVFQLRAHRDELRDAKSGCYHQGKGWLPQDGLSPAPWSRGQGWMIHGLIHSIPLLKNWPGAQQEFIAAFRELVSSLLALQMGSGFWHQLVDEPHDSFPDTSGTALIYEALELGLQQNILAPDVRTAAEKAWNVLAAQVGENGTVDQACRGPGTIWETGPWRNQRAPKGDSHGVFTMLFACAARLSCCN